MRKSQIRLYKFKANKLLSSNKFLISLFLCLGLATLYLDSKKQEPAEDVTMESADTYIPEGMVLVPIEIQNKEALSELLGGYGVIDLYIPSFGDQIRARKIASGVKIMRAPLNPEVYAVLIPEDSASQVTQFPGPFLVTIQNPNKSKTEFSKKKKTLKTTVLTEI